MSKFIFVGLGNPGPQYARTRHNAGWLALDELLKMWSEAGIRVNWKQENKIFAEVAHLKRGEHEIYLVKPQTFMNESGKSVIAALHWLTNGRPEKDASHDNLVVFHDDLDLTTGQFKLQFDSGPKIHNGLNSIRDQLHTNRFWYARLGVDSRGGERSIPGHAYVLQSLKSEEKAAIEQAIKQLAEELVSAVLK